MLHAFLQDVVGDVDALLTIDLAQLVDVHFLHVLVVLPIVSMIEKPEPLPYSITEAVLGEDKAAVLGENAQPVGV